MLKSKVEAKTTLDEATAMYERLRLRGRTKTMARLSVEARYSPDLTQQQRRDLHNYLSRHEEMAS